MQKKKLRFFPKTTLVVFLIFSFVAPSPFAVWQAMQKEKQITLFEQQEKLTPKEGEDMAIEEAAQLKKNNIEKIPAGMATDLAPTQFNANVLQKAKLAKIKKTVDPMKLGGKTIAENYAGASYNEEKKKLTIDEPIGEIKEVVFNEQNLPTKTTDTAGNTTEAKYDSLGNMLEMVNPNGDVVHYNYDKQGRLLASYVEKAAQKNKTLSFWDKLFSANSAVADTKDEVVNLAYADNNELGNIENQAGVVTQEFTENGDLSVSVDASGNLNSYEYDDNGNVIGKKTNAPVEQLSMLSSLFVNAAEETVTEQASFSYDEEGNPESSDITISIPETEEEVALADQKTLVDKLLSFLPRVSAKKMTLKKISKTGEYDEQGNLVGMKNQAGEVTAFYYDENDNPVGGATADRDGNLIFEAKYTRNEQGNWAARQDNLGNEENYTYDERGQLIKYSINGQETTYAYDERGNLVSEKNTVGELLYTYEHNKLVKVEKPDGSTKSFVYDANGNLIEKTTCADSENCQTVFYTYTTNNYLQSVTMPGKETVFYIYDGLNRRVQKTFGNKTLTYLWEGNRITGEMDENKNIVRSFVYDQEGNLLSVIKDGAVFNLIKDSHGSTVALTDENSQIVARYTYDAWGNPAQTLENSITPFLYSGYYYDQDIEAYIMGPRFYDPALKRFFQKDPAPADLNDELTLNEYIYCENNPVNNYDPDGHKSKAKNDGKSDKAAKEKAEKAAKEAEKREAEQKKKEEEARKKAEKEKEEQAKKAKEAAAKEKAKAEELKKKAKEEAERKAQEVKKKEAEAKKKAEEAAARAKKEIEEKAKKAKEEAQRKAQKEKEEAQKKKEEAERKAKKEAEEKARQLEKQQKEKAEAQKKAEKAKEEAQEKAEKARVKAAKEAQEKTKTAKAEADHKKEALAKSYSEAKDLEKSIKQKEKQAKKKGIKVEQLLVLKELFLYQREYQNVSGEKQSLSVGGTNSNLGAGTGSLSASLSVAYNNCSYGVSSASTVAIDNSKAGGTQIKGIELKLTSKTDLEKFLIGAGAAVAVVGVIYLIPAETIVAIGYAAFLAAARIMPTIYSLGNALTETPEGNFTKSELQVGGQVLMKSVGKELEKDAMKGGGQVINKIDDIFGNPNLLNNMSIKEVEELAKKEGWIIDTLSKGSREGEGMVAREVTKKGGLADRIIQWHPGGGHHGEEAYWKISSAGDGVQRIGPQF